jgi:hypothetical protein
MFSYSLVDEKSTSDHIMEHWHKLVDCKQGPRFTDWHITKVREYIQIIDRSRVQMLRGLRYACTVKSSFKTGLHICLEINHIV